MTITICGKSCQEDFYFFDLIVSGVVMVLALLISIYFAWNHLKYYNHPFYQDRIIGMQNNSFSYTFSYFNHKVILFMAPFYAITSYFGIVFVV